MNHKIDIIGAGIGGLTTALTLKQKAFDVAVYERTAKIKPVGAGIVLAINAMRIYERLGLQKKIEAVSHKISLMKITDEQLNPLSIVNHTRFEKKYDAYNVAIHRADLQKILAEELGYENINLNKCLISIAKNDKLTLSFEDQSSIESNILVGADGIKSVVRSVLFKENIIRPALQICWRGVCHMQLPEKYNNESNEAWGRGKRFGFMKLNDDQVYWYAVCNNKNIADSNINLTHLYEDYHPIISEIITNTPEEQINITKIHDLKPIHRWQQKWQDSHVCLLGDAAHASTPNLGQGACQAIEDAYIVAKCLESESDLHQSFRKYEFLRKKKAHMIVNTSWRLGKIAHLENRWGTRIRNFVMKSVPDSVSSRQLEKIFEIDE